MGSQKGTLFVISGPSGVGKGTIVERILEEHPDIWKSVSATTRAPREGDVEGQTYYFLSRDEFKKIVDDDGFLEWAEFAGNMYGTPISSVREHLDQGSDVILEIEVQGAFQVKERVPDAVLVFIEPPSMEELERRLRNRGTEDEDAIQRRLSTANMELSRKMEYDFQFVNDSLDRTVEEIGDFIEGYAAENG